MSFTDILARYTPPRLLKTWGRRWITAVGSHLDSIVPRLQAAVLVRMPKLAPDDALEEIGWERMLPKTPGEAQASHARRLWSAWDTWTFSGVHYGKMLAFEALGWSITHLDRYPGCALRDAGMARLDTRHWPCEAGATAAKDSESDGTPTLRIAATAANAYAFQDVLTDRNWRASGWVRSDGVRTPRVRFGAAVVWEGTLSTDRQPYSCTGVPTTDMKLRIGSYHASGTAGSVEFGPVLLEPDGLIADEYWPGGWPENAGGEHGHVWIVDQGEWAAPPPYEAFWSAFWPVIDLWSDTTQTEWVAWLVTGAIGASTSRTMAQIQTTGQIVRSEDASMTPRTQAACASYGECVVLFGGQTGAGVRLADTWIWWQGSDAWTQSNPATPPAARYGTAMVEHDGAVWLCGGNLATGDTDDTWKWADGEWTVMAPTDSPGNRKCHAMATFAGNIVLFGGLISAGPTERNDTWTLDWNASPTWVLQWPAHAPSARYGHSMTELDAGILLFGGVNGVTPSAETWLWNGVDWIRQYPNNSPPARYFHGAARVGANSVLIWGGNTPAPASDVWLWDGSDWSACTALSATATGCASVGTLRKVTVRRWDDGWCWDDGEFTWDTALTEVEVNTIKDSMRKWKSSECSCPELIVITSEGGWDGIWGGDGAEFWFWDDGTIWGEDAVVRIPVGE